MTNVNGLHGRVVREVDEQIQKGNPWYVGSQFEWADKPSIRRIYQKRLEYFVACIERVRRRSGTRLRLLDAGCGDGYWLWRLSNDPELEMVGMDYNPLRIRRAKQCAPAADVLLADLRGFKAKRSFDIILLNQVLEHVQDDNAVLMTARALLLDHGTLILGVPNEGSWLHQRSIRRRGRSFQTDHVHFYTERQIRRRITDAGFIIDSTMREVFYIGNDRLYYSLTARPWGFRLLELMTRMCPRECSDYYFECRPA